MFSSFWLSNVYIYAFFYSCFLFLFFTLFNFFFVWTLPGRDIKASYVWLSVMCSLPNVCVGMWSCFCSLHLNLSPPVQTLCWLPDGFIYAFSISIWRVSACPNFTEAIYNCVLCLSVCRLCGLTNVYICMILFFYLFFHLNHFCLSKLKSNEI